MGVGLVGLVLGFGLGVAAADKPADDLAAAKTHLAKMQPLVGQWRGVGQPQRGSTKDSWIEEVDWAWSFSDGASLVGQLPKGKYFRSSQLVPGAEPGAFVLIAMPTEGDKIEYVGKLDDGERLVLQATEPRAGLPERISFRFVAGGDRLLVLLERKSGVSDQFVRLAEIGYTRKGSGFGQGASQPECVVTGGLGTMEVTYEGKTYFVCCTGCRDYFNENPAEVLAEYAARKAAEKAKKEANP
jgi:ribosomal protein L24E